MAAWDSADLFDRFCLYAGRGSGGTMAADELWTAPRIYAVLADAQEAVYTDLAAIVPQALASPPVQLTSPDGGVTYTFGSAVPLSHIEVYAQELGGRELVAADYSDGAADFVIEAGGVIRAPGNRVRTYASGPWARGVLLPERISATVQPSLQPAAARELILFRALERAADVPGGGIDPQPWREQYANARQRWIQTWSRQYRTHGMQRRGGLTLYGPWWLRLDAMNGLRD